MLVVAITSNRGLAGAFNSNIIKASKALKEKTYAGKQVDFVTIGKKGNDIISKDSNVIEFNATIFDDLNFQVLFRHSSDANGYICQRVLMIR